MNLIISTINKQVIDLSNWVDSNTMPQIIDSITYNQYEDNNLLRKKLYNDKNIQNNFLRTTANTTQKIGAEIVSAYTNPFYLFHKVVNIPTYYQDVVKLYQNNS